MHGMLHPSPIQIRRIAGLVGTFRDPESLPTECEHFRHERKVLQLPSLVERCKNLLFTSNLDPVSDR
jgi:hypothetical protein